MPNRILKESINESKGLSSVTPFAQDLFKRLITYADDYGRFNGDIELIRSRLYPRELEAVLSADIEEGIIELVGVGKIRLYTGRATPRSSGGSIVFGYFPNWNEHQRTRFTRAKCPDPENEYVNDWALRRFIPIVLKEKLFERDNFSCQECGRSFKLDGIPAKRAIRLLAGALHIDHIVPCGQGGRATEENLRLLCAACNGQRPHKISLEEAALLAAKGGDLRQPAAGSASQPLEEKPERNRSRSSREEKTETRRARAREDEPPPPPPALAGFDDLLRGRPGYRPTEAYYAQVEQIRASGVDVHRELIKLADRLPDARAPCSIANVLNWLERATPDAERRHRGNGERRSKGATRAGTANGAAERGPQEAGGEAWKERWDPGLGPEPGT